MTPWCVVLVCSSRRPLADHHSLPFPWTLSLHRRWCPSPSHHPLTFLFLPALTFPLPFPFPSLGLSLRRPQCPSASPHSFPSHSLGRLCQRSHGILTYLSIRTELQARGALVQAGPNAPPTRAAWEFLDAPPPPPHTTRQASNPFWTTCPSSPTTKRPRSPQHWHYWPARTAFQPASSPIWGPSPRRPRLSWGPIRSGRHAPPVPARGWRRSSSNLYKKSRTNTGGFGMSPWCDDLVYSSRRLLADRHSLPFPWTLSLHRRWCPSASHHPLTFLFLPALTFPLPSPFPSLGLFLRRPPCPSASPHSFPSLSLGRLCQRSPRTCPVSLLCVESTQRKANAFAVGQVRPSGHPKPAVRYLSPTAAGGPWDGHLRGRFPDGGT